MPELPDIEIFSRNLNDIFSGKKLMKIRIVEGRKLLNKPVQFSKRLNGKILERIFRSGKEMRFLFKDGTMLGLHLMLTGDLFFFEKNNEHHSTIAEFYFANGKGLALTDRMKNANIKLDPIDKKGVDALSPLLTYKYLKPILQNKTTSIKKALIDQDIIRGIGNSYSDEILWQAKISPYSIANKIPDKKIKELIPIIKNTLKKETERIYKKYPGKINVEVKDFLKIHSKTRTTSPRGETILIDKKEMMKTYYTKEQVLYK